MKAFLRRAITVLPAIALLAVLFSPPARAYTPPVSVIKAGLFYGSTALEGANLQNVTGFGQGYQFGYFDENRMFVSSGAYTDMSKITMLIDKNMYFSAADGNYYAGEGARQVGCFHIQLNTAYQTFDEAKFAADMYSDSFVKFSGGTFYVSIGSYISSDAASSAMASLGIADAAVNSGSPYTVCVAATETGKILFEFDYGNSYSLAVMPLSPDGQKCSTWFKGSRYYGGFQYQRIDGGNLTVVNFADIEDYTKGSIPYEMNNSWPIEALKAQALCARTYAMRNLNKHKAHGFDLCTLEHCQVYRGLGGTSATYSANETTDRAVDETAGMYITYNGVLCETYYSSSDGGATENSENVWVTTLPYLRGVIDPYEADVASRISNYSWTVTYTPEQITQRMRVSGYNCATIVSMQVTEFTPTGNVLKVTLKDSNGTSFSPKKREELVSILGVRSQRFTIGGATQTGGGIYIGDSNTPVSGGTSMYAIGADGTVSEMPDGSMYAITGSGSMEIVTGEPGVSTGGSENGMVNGVFTINGTGNGHHVGMSQWGAYSMAYYHNKTYYDIINFYFTGVTIG